MPEQRYNSFNQIHKGLRAFMYDTAVKLQQTELSGNADSMAVIDQVSQLIEMFEDHAHHEDYFFNSPLEQHDPEVASLFQKEHEEDHRLGIVLQSLLRDWRSATDSGAKIDIGTRLFYAFNEFIAFNLYHMNKEEIVLNRVLWRTYSDEQIMVIEQAIVQSVPPQKMMVSMKWMIRGINDAELIHWIDGVNANAPAQVYAILISMVEKELEPTRWSRIERQLDKSISLLKMAN